MKAATKTPADVSAPTAEAVGGTPDEADDPDVSPEEEIRTDEVLTVDTVKKLSLLLGPPHICLYHSWKEKEKECSSSVPVFQCSSVPASDQEPVSAEDCDQDQPPPRVGLRRATRDQELRGLMT